MLIVYPDNTDYDKDRQISIYYRGADNLPRLIAVKAQYDKYNYLDFPMGIPTSY